MSFVRHRHPRRLPVPMVCSISKPERMHALFTFGCGVCDARRIVDDTGGIAATVLPGFADSAWINPQSAPETQ